MAVRNPDRAPLVHDQVHRPADRHDAVLCVRECRPGVRSVVGRIRAVDPFGRVRLAGVVEDRLSALTIEDLAWSLPQVTDCENLLQVRDEGFSLAS